MRLTIHWYGVLFALGLISAHQVLKWIYVTEGHDVDSLDNLVLYSVVGIIIGARLAHVLFYDPAYYFAHPIKIFAIWEGGLASHGGAIGAILAVYYYHRKVKMPFLFILDRVAVVTAIFAFFVRIGNFFNSEILGIPSTVPWAIIFARVDMQPRHPAQLYEAAAYLSIFIVMLAVFKLTSMKDKYGAICGLFLILVFGSRFIIEFVKVRQAAYATGWELSTGQLLSIPFLIVGAVIMILPYLRKR